MSNITGMIKPFFSLPKKYSKSYAIPEKIWQDPLYFIAFGFGSGAIPFAPGTFGTLMSIPFYLLVKDLSLSHYLLLVIILIIASSCLCEKISNELNILDHPNLCIDEFIGFFVTMIHAPLGLNWIIIGFLLFRLFDIWKPWPIRYLDEKIHGGFGMILDDVVAGLFAMIIMQLLFYFANIL